MMRQEPKRGRDVISDSHPWAQALDTLYEHGWQRLIRGVNDRHAPARHPTLATVSSDGLPQARTVVLRGADKAIGRLEIHTHLHSSKITDLKARPVAAVHVWDSGQKLQIRLQANAEIVTGPQAAAAWAKVPEGSRTAYGAQAPGSSIADSLAYDGNPDPEAFAIVLLHLMSMDILHLGPDHRRAVYTRQEEWKGRWVVP